MSKESNFTACEPMGENPTVVIKSNGYGVKSEVKNSSNNALNVNNNGNVNNNNKTNEYGVLPVFECPKKYCPCKDFYTYEEILKAYLDCRKRKRNSKQAMEFEYDFENNLRVLLDEINNRTYKIGSSRCFVIGRPKPREVWAAFFRDRIVHHLVYNTIHEWFEKRFIVDTCSCIKKRGTLYARDRLYKHCRRLSGNWGRKIYCLKMDITGYFMSINKDILWDMLSARLENRDSLTAWLLKKIIYNDLMENNPVYIKNEYTDKLDPSKSIINTPKSCGLPIGNLTSQFFSNLYLNELDQYCKHVLKIKHYVRYVDDIVILHTNTKQLKEWEVRIKEFIKERCRLRFHDVSQIVDIQRSITFVGYKIKPFRCLPKLETVRNAWKSAYEYYKKPFLDNYEEKCISQLALLKQSKTYKVRNKIKEKYFSNVLIYPIKPSLFA